MITWIEMVLSYLFQREVPFIPSHYEPVPKARVI